jgi:hypothetical protein
MKQFATWFTHGVPGGSKLRAAIYHARTGSEVLAQVELFFASPFPDGSASSLDFGVAPGMDCGSESEDESSCFPEASLVCD